ncbi:activator 1 subunit 3 [Reticulomyxa filosa]|uniref:Activator 1 subunit 3 n=1 Tax=Reticulomyxa filosa TaxID=46433 RepID=X6M9F3_RETFI|nr:activator 1 subunit 3 [Reticulomyxa filosa]|eukprot:ETO10509.1 activator 1 subunit 3 [Reticulomyxa filosa]
MEKYTKNTRFCIICNYVNKIIPALQSRCTKFRFAPLAKTDVENCLKKICETENVNYEDAALKWIVKLSQDDMCKSLNILQATHSDVERILKWLLNEEFSVAFAQVQSVQIKNGLALIDIVASIHELVLKMQTEPSFLSELVSRLCDLESRLVLPWLAFFSSLEYASFKGKNCQSDYNIFVFYYVLDFFSLFNFFFF